MKKTVMKSAGSFTRFTISQRRSSPTSSRAKNGSTYVLAGRRARTMGSLDASLTIDRIGLGAGQSLPGALFSPRCLRLGRQVPRRHDRLERIQLARLLLIDRDRCEVRVSLRVEREGPEDPVGHLQPEQLRG